MADSYSGPWIKMMRSEETLELLTDPAALALLALIACRAQRTASFNRHGLEPNQAFIGDYKACGLSEQEYRTAKTKLSNWRFATFKPTNKGTIATLISTRIFDINADPVNGQNNIPSTDEQRTGNGQTTTNKNDKNGKKAFSTKASKLSRHQKELADQIELLLGNQWVNDAGKWINRIKSETQTAARVIAELKSATTEQRIKSTPAQYAEQIWKEFK